MILQKQQINAINDYFLPSYQNPCDIFRFAYFLSARIYYNVMRFNLNSFEDSFESSS